jgi:hypothetical protein
MMVGKPHHNSAAQRRAEVLRPIFDELARMSDKEAAEELNRRDVEAPGAKWHWDATMVKRVRQRLTALRLGSKRI